MKRAPSSRKRKEIRKDGYKDKNKKKAGVQYGVHPERQEKKRKTQEQDTMPVSSATKTPSHPPMVYITGDKDAMRLLTLS